ncbi:MAG: acetolactate synthase small subunit [Spirochaetaceae bacterium]|nr:MAG: acetolactate synthase small subunit [Spirochaetaceae bacterium]
MTHVVSLLVENHQGVLARIAGLFSGRAYNLESLTVGITTDPSVSRITLVCSGDDNVIEQIKKQLNKLIDVIKLTDLTGLQSVHRELALIKVTVPAEKRGEIFQIADVFRAKVVDVGTEAMVIEVTGAPEKIDDMLTLLSGYTALEVARSGLVSIERGKKIKKAAKGA